jgi:hypothetical protein
MDRLWQIHRIATQSRVLPEDVDRIAELSEGFAPIPPCSICKQSHAEPEQDCPQLRAGASAAIPEAPEALRLIARMLPYVQQMEAADAAEMDAQQCLIHEVEKCLAAVSAATAETPESLATPAFLRAIIAALIEGIRSVEIDRREWYTHIAQPLQDAYQAIGGPKDLGLTPEEIAKLRDESPGASAAARVTGWRPPDRADLISMAASVAREARRHLDNGHKHHANILQMASAVLLNLSDSALFAAGQAATPNTLLKDDTP